MRIGFDSRNVPPHRLVTGLQLQPCNSSTTGNAPACRSALYSQEHNDGRTGMAAALIFNEIGDDMGQFNRGGCWTN